MKLFDKSPVNTFKNTIKNVNTIKKCEYQNIFLYLKVRQLVGRTNFARLKI